MMGSGGGGSFLDDFAASGGDTTVLQEEENEEGGVWGWGIIPDPVDTTTPDLIEPEPVWEQPSPSQAQDDDLEPREWTITWLRCDPTGPREATGIVKMSRVELEEHLQENMSFRVTDSDSHKGNIPAGKVVCCWNMEDER